MEILLLVVILIIVLVNFSKLFRRIEEIDKRLHKLNMKLWKDGQVPTPKAKEEVRAEKTEEKTVEPQPPAESIKKPDPPIIPERKVVMADSGKREIRREPEKKTEGISNIRQESKRSVNKAPKLSFFEKNPDLERFVGENLVNKIGIGILVLGIAYFVKYAIDQNWINEIARVGIGILAGGILIAIAHRMRNTYKAFSSVLVGGGISVLYFTIAIAYHQYEIIGQTPAFIIMVVITAFAVFLSTVYDKVELAVLSLIGGFATPFILSSGEGNYLVLFTYISILNIGMLVLASMRKWVIINYLSYVFTIIVFGGWIIGKALNMEAPPYLHILMFATLFYLIFFLMNIINNVRAKRKFNGGEVSLLLSNTFLYYAVGLMAFRSLYNGDFQGLFTTMVGIINFIFAFFLYKKDRVDKNLVYLLIGLVLTFVTLAGPVQLEGNYITLFWSAESVLLLWLAYKSGIRALGLGSVILTVLMLISLIMDWSNLYFNYEASLQIVLNKAYLTGVFSVTCLLLSRYLLNTHKDFQLFIGVDENNPTLKLNDFNNELGLTTQNYLGIMSVLILSTLYLVNLLELNFQLNQHIAFPAIRSVIIASYHFSFFIFLYFLGKKLKSAALLNFSLLTFSLGMISYLVYFNMNIIDLRNVFLSSRADYLSMFLYHYIDFALILGMLTLIVVEVRKNNVVLVNIKNETLSALSIYLIILLSLELDHIVSWLAFSPSLDISYIITQNHKIGFPILWGLYAFGLMWLGMKYKIKSMRFIALGLLLITLLKLFIYDIRDVSEAGKIIAFICLGVLLLIISFMYQRLKKLIIDDTEMQKKEDEHK